MSLVKKKDLENGNYQHIIIRYVDSVSFETVKILLGVHDAEEDAHIPCTNMKNDIMIKMFNDPVVSDTCSDDSYSSVSYNDIQSILRKMYFIIKKVLQIFEFEVDISLILQDKQIFNIIEGELNHFHFLRNELRGLKNQNLRNPQVKHEDIVRNTYQGNQSRCYDILDTSRECQESGTPCLPLHQARTLRNLLLVYYMLNTQRLLSQEQIDSILFLFF
jgi:hypothetical protein